MKSANKRGDDRKEHPQPDLRASDCVTVSLASSARTTCSSHGFTVSWRTISAHTTMPVSIAPNATERLMTWR